jgi:hypothetical protein
MSDREGTHESPSTKAVIVQAVGCLVYTLFATAVRKFIATVSFIYSLVVVLISAMRAAASVKGLAKLAVWKLGIRSLNCRVYVEIRSIAAKDSENCGFI